MSLSLDLDSGRVHCIPGSTRNILVEYRSDLRHGESCLVETLSARVFGVSKARVQTNDPYQVHEFEVQFLELKDDGHSQGWELDVKWSKHFKSEGLKMRPFFKGCMTSLSQQCNHRSPLSMTESKSGQMRCSRFYWSYRLKPRWSFKKSCSLPLMRQ